MSQHVEIQFGFVGYRAIQTSLAPLGIAFAEPTRDDNDNTAAIRAQIFETSFLEKHFCPEKIMDCYAAITHQFGWVELQRTSDTYIAYKTPYGKRNTHPFALTMKYDPIDADENPQDATFGFNLTGRNQPVLLDAQSYSAAQKGDSYKTRFCSSPGNAGEGDDSYQVHR